MKIVIAGTGYLGLSNDILLAQHHEVVLHDIVPEKAAMFNPKASLIVEVENEDCIQHKPLNLHDTLDKLEAYEGGEIVIITTPTHYNPEMNTFITRSVEDVVHDVLTIDCGITLVHNNSGLVALVGDQNLVVVTLDTVLAADWSRSQDMKHIVNPLSSKSPKSIYCTDRSTAHGAGTTASMKAGASRSSAFRSSPVPASSAKAPLPCKALGGSQQYRRNYLR